jgi:tetratricopeptide (TPR) repeat protein
MSGRALAAEDAQALETRIEQDPQDVTSRTKLLGYYFGKQFQNRSAREAKQKHVLWLIQNAPESAVLGMPEGTLDAILDPDAYSRGKRAWIDQLKKEPANLKLLGNSAVYFLQHDRTLALESLKKARSLDTDNPKWPDRLGHLYTLDMISNSVKERTDSAGKALEQFEIAYKLSTETGQDAMLQYLAKVALAANNQDKAKEYADKMVSQSGSGWNSGNNIHYGHIVLGRLALKQGRIDEAKEHLIKAGKTPGSPQLNSFGPNMTLAKDLLEKREQDVVLEYFQLCSKFWKLHRDRLDQWSTAVKAGNMPDFGANLNY